MASRMERYANNEERSLKNEDLYKQMQDAASYTSIEGIASFDKTNEVDITRVKEMLKNRENYQQEKKYRQILKPTEENIVSVVPEDIEEKNYDIRDVLTKAKDERNDDANKYRRLKETQYEILRKLNVKEESPKVSRTVQPSDDLDLLDDLKSNTMVGDASSIKKIIDAERATERLGATTRLSRTVQLDNTDNMDKSFFTSSYNFTDDDFEELKDITTTIKKNNTLIKTLIIICAVIVAVFIGYLIFKFGFSTPVE